MRLFLACFLLVGCSASDDTFIGVERPDATSPPESGVTFKDAAKEASGPVYVGGPLACGKCTCDGTLYACLEGVINGDAGCAGAGKPPPPPPPDGDASADADADADAESDAATCGNGMSCSQIPIGCLPKPTCDCITKETGMLCMVAPNGNGFVVQCP